MMSCHPLDMCPGNRGWDRETKKKEMEGGPSSILSPTMPALHQLQGESQPWTLSSEAVLLLGKHSIHHPREKGRVSQDRKWLQTWHRASPAPPDPGNELLSFRTSGDGSVSLAQWPWLGLSKRAVPSGTIINSVEWVWASSLAAGKDDCVPGREACSQLPQRALACDFSEKGKFMARKL